MIARELLVLVLVLAGTVCCVGGCVRGAERAVLRWLLVLGLVAGWLALLPVLGEVDLLLAMTLAGLVWAVLWGPALLRAMHPRSLGLLAPYARGARRRLGGHWEQHAEADGLLLNGYHYRWHQVPTCHKELACVFHHGAGCSLVDCEEWDYHVGPDDNLVGPDDPALVPRLEQEYWARQRGEEARRQWETQRAQEQWEARRARRRSIYDP